MKKKKHHPYVKRGGLGADNPDSLTLCGHLIEDEKCLTSDWNLIDCKRCIFQKGQDIFLFKTLLSRVTKSFQNPFLIDFMDSSGHGDYLSEFRKKSQGALKILQEFVPRKRLRYRKNQSE
jgi:hypothetical protein